MGCWTLTRSGFADDPLAAADVQRLLARLDRAWSDAADGIYGILCIHVQLEKQTRRNRPGSAESAAAMN